MNGVNGGLLGPRRDPFGGLGVTTTLERALVVGTDSSFANVELLLPMTGSNSGTTFTDVSSKNYAITRTGAVTSTARWPFTGSGSSGLFDGTSNYLTAGSATDWKFLHDGSTDYTIEALVYMTNTASSYIASTSAYGIDAGFWFGFELGNLAFGITRGVPGDALSVLGATTASTNTWHHAAVVYQVLPVTAAKYSKVTVYLNGTSDGSTSSSGFAFSSSNPFNILQVGRYATSSTSQAAGGYLPGNISNLRITKQARYTGNFTAPTMPLFAR